MINKYKEKLTLIFLKKKIKKRFVGFVKVLYVIMYLTRESEGPFIFSTDTYINEI